MVKHNLSLRPQKKNIYTVLRVQERNEMKETLLGFVEGWFDVWSLVFNEIITNDTIDHTILLDGLEKN